MHAQDQNTSRSRRRFAAAGPWGPADRAGSADRAGRWACCRCSGRSSDLTDAQKDQVKAIADSHNDEWKALADRGRAAHVALDEAITADTVDEALIRQKSAEVAAVDADMAVARAHAHAEVLPDPDRRSADAAEELQAR